VTTHRRKKAERATPRPAATPFTPQLKPSEEDLREPRDPPYDMGGPEYPEHWLPGLLRRPAYVLVIDQLRSQRPDQPRSPNQILESLASRTRDPEPDLEAEP
jgi:hypothetical protein